MRTLLFLVAIVIAFPIIPECQHFAYDHIAKELQLWANSRESAVPTLHFRDTELGDDWFLKHDGSKFHIMIEDMIGYEKLTVQANGRVGIGTRDPLALLQVSSNGTINLPQILIHEDGLFDFARLRMTDNTSPNFWDIAGMTSGNHNNSALNLYYNGFGNILTLKGSGFVGINKENPVAPLHLVEQFGAIEIMRFEHNSGNFWDIDIGNEEYTFGFKYNGFLKAFIDSDDGTYHFVGESQSNKAKGKMENVLPRLSDIAPSTYLVQKGAAKGSKRLALDPLEVSKSFPELISRFNNTESIDYIKLSVVAIQGLKEQQSRIERQESILKEQSILIKELSLLIESMSSKLDQVTSQIEHRD